MADNSEPDWARAADYLNRRIDELGYSKEEVAHAAGKSRATIRELLSGVPRNRPASTLARVSLAVRWKAGSLAAILAGGEPEMLPESVVRLPPADSDELIGRIQRGAEEAWMGPTDQITLEELAGRVDRIEEGLKQLRALVSEVVSGGEAEGGAH